MIATTMDSDLIDEIPLAAAPLYAIDLHGVCHVFDQEINEQSLSTRPNDHDETISQSIIAPPNPIESSSLKPFLSTQPFSIVDLNENDFPSLEPIAICSPVARFSGQIASQYRNETLFCQENIASKVSTKKKKLKRIGSAARRFNFVKKQLRIFLKKKKLRKKPIQDTSTTICEDPKPIEPSSPEDDDPMLNPSLSPDLSKRKYIYKDISTTAATTTSVNPINWKMFQCTQTQSAISYRDSSTMNDQVGRPIYLANHSVSLPDIRIGLSRHQSTKQLHKTLLN